MKSKLLINTVLGVSLLAPLTVQSKVNPIEQRIMKFYDNPFKYLEEHFKQRQIDKFNEIETKRLEEMKITKTVKDKGQMELEELVYLGLIAEVGYPSFDLEAYKAQAVAIRTFILSNIKHKGKGFDLCGTTCCFALPDDKKIQGFTQEQLNRFKQAQEETKGQVLTYDGEIISTPVFFAYGHGQTNAPEDVWSNSDNNKYPYLKPVDTPEMKQPQEIVMDKQEFLNKLNVKSFDEIDIKDRAFSGYVKSVRVGNKSYKGDKIRDLIKGLKSGNFHLYDLGDKVKIVAYGYGHGIGMSQFGADTMAKQGKTYDEILKHYYTGIEIQQLSDLL